MAEISWIDDIITSMCTIEGNPCFGSGDAISTGIGGLVAGTIAIWIYAWRKNGEYVDLRNDVARIQANEVASNVEVLHMYRERQRRVTASTRPPTMEIYKGLLSSGNIRYLGDDLQDMLAQIYHDLKVHPFDPDMDRHKQVLERLNDIMDSRDRYFTLAPFWMWRARRRLHSRH